MSHHKSDDSSKDPVPLTGLAVPDYEYTEERGYKVAKGDKIRLRETDNNTGKETGWEVGTTLTHKPEYWTLADFEEKFYDGKVTNKFARQYGFTDSRAMYTEISNWFSKVQKPKDAADNRIMLLRFKPVSKKEGMTYFRPNIIPRAAVIDYYYESKRAIHDRWGAFSTRKPS